MIEKLKKKLLLQRLRRELQFWGIDTSQLSDDELELKLKEMCQRLHVATQAMGVAARQAANALQNVAHAMGNAPIGVQLPRPRRGRSDE